TGPTNGPDFHIDYGNGRSAVGEVGWHENPEIQQMWAETLKREEHQQIRLHPGTGVWSVHLLAGASIRTLYRDLPDLLAEMRERNRTELQLWTFPDWYTVHNMET